MGDPYIHLVGNVGRDPDVKHYRKDGEDQTLVSFSLAVPEAPTRDAATQWWTVAVFNPERAAAVMASVYKGARVCVSGYAKTQVREGKTYRDITATSVGLVQFVGGAKAPRAAVPRPAPAAPQEGAGEDF